MFIANREWWEPPSSGMVLDSSAKLPVPWYSSCWWTWPALVALNGVSEQLQPGFANWWPQPACVHQTSRLLALDTETAHTHTPIPPLQKQQVHKTLHNWVFGREHGKIAHLTFCISMYKYVIKNVITQLRWFIMLTHQSDNLISMAEPIAWWIALMARGQMSRHNSPQPRLRMSKNKR